VNAIEIRAAVKAYGKARVLDRVDLTVGVGSVTAILGASGSGKTTLLRLIAGFDRLDSGELVIDGIVMDDSKHVIGAQHRGVGYVPQDGALFPHLTAAANVSFGLSRSERGRALELLALVGLDGLGARRPHELSGGQQQRVALARALAVRPKVVLLDEPFASLDGSLRSTIRRDVVQILSEAGTTTIIVTHDQDEALSMSDQVAVLVDGRIVTTASPRELYTMPGNQDAARHIGEANLLSAVFLAGKAVCVLGELPLRQAAADDSTMVLVRPEQLELRTAPSPGAAAGVIAGFEYFGHDALARIILDADGTLLHARLPGERRFSPQDEVWVTTTGAMFAL
jgi:iron(III) transport system ATP-binding protein